MINKGYELWIAFFFIIFFSLIYLLGAIILGGIPPASEFFGHSLGIFGFVLMLSTETLYTLRKRSRFAQWGRLSTWLQIHIITGIVGPFLVLLHSSWKFNGLAGVVMLLTITIVVSGFIGRYIYTAIPRTADGIEIISDELKLAALVTARKMFALWHTIHIPLGITLFVAVFIHILAAIYYASLLR
jgi:hypothetical protein